MSLTRMGHKLIQLSDRNPHEGCLPGRSGIAPQHRDDGIFSAQVPGEARCQRTESH